MTVSRDNTWTTDDADILSEAEYSIPASVSSAGSVGEDNVSHGTTTGRQVGGAAVAGGIVGLLLAGPIGGLVAAGGSAVLASSCKGKVGEIARSSGEVVANAGDSLKQVNQKHQVTARASEGLSKSVVTLKEFDEKHQICAKTKDGLSKSLEKAKEFDKKHQVSAKAAGGFVKGCNWISRKLESKDGHSRSSSTQQNLTS